MSMKSTREDRADAPAYARRLRGLGVNLLVRDIRRALPFHLEVLGAECLYDDEDFAALRHTAADGTVAEWMLHADHSYDHHPLGGLLGEARGCGAELRLYGRDPDIAEAAARRLDCHVLAAAGDTAHGLREVFLIEPDGYVWVPCRALAPGEGS